MRRATAPALLTLTALLLVGCSSASEVPAPPSTSVAPDAPTVAPADLSDPCTLLTADEINAVLGTSFPAGQATNDDARQVGDCKYTSDDMTAIVDVALSRADGAESFTTNVDLAPAYFGGKAKPIEIPGAEKAYLVIADTYDAPVVGILVDGTFAQVQVGVEGATPQQAEQLAATMAARL